MKRKPVDFGVDHHLKSRLHIGYKMGTFQKVSTLARAETILAIAQTMLRDDDDDFFVSAFKAGKATGLQVSTWDLERRCNVLGNTNSDGYVVSIGTGVDFDYESGQAMRSVSRFDFGFNEPFQAAQCLVNWLRNGMRPANREASSF